MSCSLTHGMSINCREGIGGIKAVYLGTFATFGENSATINGTTNIVTALATGTIYKYDCPKNTGSFTEEAAISIENGTIFYTQTVVAALHGLSSARSLELQNMAKGRLVVFVQDSNDNIWMVGYHTSAEVTAFTTQTGVNKGDMNGYNITFTAEEKNKAYMLDAFDPATEDPFDNFAGITVSTSNI